MRTNKPRNNTDLTRNNAKRTENDTNSNQIRVANTTTNPEATIHEVKQQLLRKYSWATEYSASAI